MKATKLQALCMEVRTLREGVHNVIHQRHQFSRELRHIPSGVLLLLLLAVSLASFPKGVQAPTSCPVCPSASVTVLPCEIPKTGAEIVLQNDNK